jgi:putative nucleotidyltransferase with HDIG domain
MMRDRHNYVNVRPYLPHALVATLGVVGLPALAVYGLVKLADPAPNFLVLLAVGFAVTAIATGLGLALWKTRPESGDIAFGELLIWGWLQRKRADDRLDEGAALLGLDRSGHPTNPVKIGPERQLAVLQDLNEALEAKDPYTHGHSQRVERHSYRTAAAMGLAVDAIEELRLAAALHDVGKIRVPDRVLRKPGRLTQEEREIIEEHVVVGAWMVSNVGSADVVSSVRHHHERWDGRGYPDGLAGTDIPLFARVIAVADAYDAITSTRPYRVSSGREHAVSVLRAEAGAQFDPMVVDSFIDALPVRLPVAGALVLLAGPAALGRKLALWLKRIGGGHLAPAAATLGAVVTLGSFAPATVAPPRALPELAIEQVTAEPVAQPVPASKPHRAPAPKVKEQAPEPEPQVAERDVVLGERVHSSEPAKETQLARPEPDNDPAEVEEPENPDQQSCGKGPQGHGEESSRKGRSTAKEASDGRGPNHC